MSDIWITSDLHLFHNKPFIYEPRGFNSVYEMNNAILYNWNSVVEPDDHVYCLGDLMLNNNEEGIRLIKQLKGNIHVVRGNHDSDVRMNLYNTCYNIVEITEGQFFQYNQYHFYLSHYPCLTSNYDDDKPLKAKIINLCGHRHDKNKFCDMDKGIIFHVELDTNNMHLWLIDDIINEIKKYYNSQPV